MVDALFAQFVIAAVSMTVGVVLIVHAMNTIPQNVPAPQRPTAKLLSSQEAALKQLVLLASPERRFDLLHHIVKTTKLQDVR